MNTARFFTVVLALSAMGASDALIAQTAAPEPKAAQASAPEARAPEQAAKPKAPLKLRLDDATSAAPRVTFTPRQGETTEKPGDALPSLGGERSRAFDESMRRSSTTPFPPDTNPNR